MGTWFDARLVVSGPKATMQRFVRRASRAAALAGDEKTWIERCAIAMAASAGVERAAKRFEKIQAADPHFFTHDFKFGEGTDLWSTRMRRVGRRYEKLFGFRMKNTDGRDYFPQVSRDWPDLQFILVTACEEEIRSCLLSAGKCREYRLPPRKYGALLRKHGHAGDIVEVDDWVYLEATSDAMDLAVARWRPLLGKTKRRRRRRGKAPQGARLLDGFAESKECRTWYESERSPPGDQAR